MSFQIEVYRTLQDIPAEVWDRVACYGEPQMHYGLLKVVDRLYGAEQNMYYLLIRRGGEVVAVSFWIKQTVSLRDFLRRYDFQKVLNLVPNLRFSYLESRVPFSSAPGLIFDPGLSGEEKSQIAGQIARFLETSAEVARTSFIMFAKNSPEDAKFLEPLCRMGYQRMSQYDIFYLNLEGYRTADEYFRQRGNSKFVKEIGRYYRKLEKLGILTQQEAIAHEDPGQIYEIIKSTMGKYRKEPVPLEYWQYMVESCSPLVKIRKYYNTEGILRIEIFFVNPVTGCATGTFTGATYPGVPGANLYDLCNYETLDWLCKNGFTEYVLGPGSQSLKQKYSPVARQVYAFMKICNPVGRWLLKPAQWAFNRYNQWKQKHE